MSSKTSQCIKFSKRRGQTFKTQRTHSKIITHCIWHSHATKNSSHVNLFGPKNLHTQTWGKIIWPRQKPHKGILEDKWAGNAHRPAKSSGQHIYYTQRNVGRQMKKKPLCKTAKIIPPTHLAQRGILGNTWKEVLPQLQKTSRFTRLAHTGTLEESSRDAKSIWPRHQDIGRQMGRHTNRLSKSSGQHI